MATEHFTDHSDKCRACISLSAKNWLKSRINIYHIKLNSIRLVLRLDLPPLYELIEKATEHFSKLELSSITLRTDW